MPILSAELFSIPLPETGRHLVYAPLRQAAFVANTAAVNFMAGLQEGSHDQAADPRLKKRIRQFIRRTEAGEQHNPARWLPTSILEKYLADEDEVVQVMAAQMLGQRCLGRSKSLSVPIFEKMKTVLAQSEYLHWQRRATAKDVI